MGASSLKGEFSCIEVVRVVRRGGRSERRALQIHVVSVDVEPLQKTEPCAKLLSCFRRRCLLPPKQLSVVERNQVNFKHHAAEVSLPTVAICNSGH